MTPETFVREHGLPNTNIQRSCSQFDVEFHRSKRLTELQAQDACEFESDTPLDLNAPFMASTDDSGMLKTQKEALQREVERLRSVMERDATAHQHANQLQEENGRLRREVETLVAAGHTKTDFDEKMNLLRYQDKRKADPEAYNALLGMFNEAWNNRLYAGDVNLLKDQVTVMRDYSLACLASHSNIWMTTKGIKGLPPTETARDAGRNRRASSPPKGGKRRRKISNKSSRKQACSL